MTDLITPDIRRLLDREWPTVEYEVDAAGIRLWAEAVGFDDPVFYDDDVARSRGHEGIPAPPGFVGTPVRRFGEPDPGPPIRGLNPSLTRSLNGGTEFGSVVPIVAGDRLLASTRIVDVQQKTGTLGEMLIITRETEYRRGSELVATVRATVINY